MKIEFTAHGTHKSFLSLWFMLLYTYKCHMTATLKENTSEGDDIKRNGLN